MPRYGASTKESRKAAMLRRDNQQGNTRAFQQGFIAGADSKAADKVAQTYLTGLEIVDKDRG
jgi:hypothetical protein